MSDLTVANYLGMLLEDPHDAGLLDGLRGALGRIDPSEGAREDPLRLIEAARGGHVRRGEFQAAAGLIEIEAELVTDDPLFHRTLVKELGRMRREELMDDEGAKRAYDQLGGRRSEDPEVVQAVEQIEQASQRWRPIADRFVSEAREATDARLKSSLLTRAASLIWQYGGQECAEESDAIFEEALEADASYARAAQQYGLTLRRRARWEDVASVFVKAAHAARGRDDKAAAWLQAARVRRCQLDDQVGAAEAYERVLDVSPSYDEALSALVSYFTELEAWDELAAMYEAALRSRQKLEAEKGMLLQLAMVHWRYRKDPEVAEPFFARLRKIDAGHPGMLDFYRELFADADPDDCLLKILGDALRTTTDRGAQLALARELGQRAQQAGRVERAVEAWKLVERFAPGDPEAREALRELYQDQGKWNALSESIRQEIEALPREAVQERLELLRRLVPIYRDELGLDSMLIQVYSEILGRDPKDAEALQALTSLYEDAGRWHELIHVLERRADASDELETQVELWLRIAELWTQRFANLNQATDALEHVVKLQPDHREALFRLKETYAKKRKWKPLFAVLSKEAALCEDDPDSLLATKVQMAELSASRLHQNQVAIGLWKEVLEAAPDTPGALDALEQLAEREKDWDTLAQVLRTRSNTAANDSDRLTYLQRLGSVYMDRLSLFEEAVETWRRVLALDPDNSRVRRMLKDAYVQGQDWASVEALYAEGKEWEALADVLSQAAERAEEDAVKLDLSFRAAAVYQDRIGEPKRALRSYERVLSVDPGNVDAAAAVAPLYKQAQRWDRYARTLEAVEAASAPDGDLQERLGRLEELRQVSLHRLKDPSASFRWAGRAFALDPASRSVVIGLEESAEAAGAYAGMVGLLRTRLEDPSTPAEERLSLQRRVASIAGERLNESDESIRQLESILAQVPDDAEAMAVLDRLYRSERRFGDLRGLYERRLAHANDPAERWVLLNEVAQLEEEQLGDLEAAADRHWQILETDANDAEALRAVERLSQQLQQWERLEGALERKLQVTTADEIRLAVILQLADLRRLHLGNPEAAIDGYRQALSIEPRNEVATAGLEALLVQEPPLAERVINALEGAYVKRGEFTKLASILRERLEASEDDAERQSLRLRLAELSASELGDTSGAYDAIESAFLDNPSDLDLLDRFGGVAEAADRHEEFVEAVKLALASTKQTPEVELTLCRRAAEVFDVVLGRPEEAAGFHRRVLEIDPEDGVAFVALKQLYTKAEHWNDLRGLYQQRIQATDDAGSKLDLLLQVCFLFEEILDEPLMAVEAYEQAIELDPGHTPSRRALQRLYVRLERWAELVELLRRDLDEAQGQEAVDLAYEIAQLYETRLGSEAEAVDHYELVLASSPTHLRAQEGLERLMARPEQRQRVAAILEPIFDSQGAWLELAKVLDVQLEDLSEPSMRAAQLSRIGELSETKLHDAARAFEAYFRAVREDVVDGSARADLGRVAASTGRQRERAELLEDMIASLPDDYVKTELLLELAEIWDAQEPDPARAERAYQQLRAFEPDNAEIVLTASRALERLHIAAGDHAALAQDLRCQIRFEEEGAVRAALLRRLAVLLDEQLGDSDGAIDAQLQRLEIDPSAEEVLVALQDLYQRVERWEPLIDVLEKRVELADADDARLVLLRHIGRIFEEELQSIDDAIQTYRDVLSRFGAEAQTVADLKRLYRQTESWRELLDVTEIQAQELEEPGERLAARFEAAELMRNRTEEPERAFESYCEILDASAGHAPSLGALEQLAAEPGSPLRGRAASRLFDHYRSLNQYADQVRMLQIVATAEEPNDRVEALLQAAEICEMGLEDARAAFDFVGRALRDGIHSGALERALLDYARHAEDTGQWSAYVHTLTEVAPEILDGDLRTEVRIKLATIAAKQLNDPAVARSQYEQVLADQPDHRGSLDALLALVEASGDPLELVELLRRKAELVEDRSERAALLVRQAVLYESDIEDFDSAIESYDRALTEDDPLEAYEGLERLYRRDERWDDLGTLYERKIDQRIGEPAGLRLQLGELCLRKLDDPWRAFDQLREALSRDPEHEPTIALLEELLERPDCRGTAAELLEPIFLRKMSWPRLTEILEVRLEGEQDPVQRGEILRRLGDVQESHLEDLEGAMRTYARLFAEDPQDHASQETLTRIARVLGRWDALAAAFDTTLSGVEVDDQDTAALAFRTAQLYDERLDDLEKAARYYRRAVIFDPSNKAAAEALASVYARGENWLELLELDRDRESFAQTDGERVALLHEIGRIEARKLDAPEDAILAYRRILELDPQDKEAVSILDELLQRTEHWDDLIAHIEFQIDGARDVRGSISLRQRLGSLLRDKQQDIARALDVFEDVLSEDPQYAPALQAVTRLLDEPDHADRAVEILEPLHRDGGAWPDLIRVLERKAERATDALERSGIWQEVGLLHEEQGRDTSKAFTAWARALCSDPASERAQSEVDRLARARGQFDAYVQVYGEAAELAEDLELKTAFWRKVAVAQDRELGDPRAAIRTYQRLVDEEPDAESVLDELEGLLVMVGDWQGLARVYEQKIHIEQDPMARAELLNRMGGLWEEPLSDAERAVAFYQQATVEAPDDVSAYVALDRLFLAAHDNERLVDVLERRFGIETDTAARVEVGLRLAELYETELGRPEAACDALNALLEIEPGHREALQTLGRLYERQGQWPELVEVLRRRIELCAEATERIETIHRLGKVVERELDDSLGAVTVYAEALSIDSAHEPSLQALLRIARLADFREDAAAVLEPRLREHERWDELAGLLQLKADAMTNPFDRGRLLAELADVHETGRRDLGAAFEALLRAIAERPDEEHILARAESMAGSLERWEELSEVLFGQASASLAPELAAALYQRVAQIAETQLRAPARAIDAYERALALLGDQLPVLWALDRLFEATQQWERLHDVLARRLAAGDEARPTLLLRQGQIRASYLGDLDGALGAYQKALEKEPTRTDAIAALRRLADKPSSGSGALDLLEEYYRSSEDLEQVVGLYERRVELADSDEDRVRLLTEAAAIWERELGRPDLALLKIKDALRVEPRNDALLGSLERLAESSDGWEQLRGLVEDIALRGELARRELYELKLRSAGWYLDKLGDQDAAERALSDAIQLDAEPLEAHERRVRLLRSQGRSEDLVGALRAWATVEPKAGQRIELLREAAVLARDAVGDAELAADCYGALLVIQRDDLDALQALCEIRRSQSRWNDVIGLLERQSEASSDPERAAGLRRDIGAVYAEQLSDSRGAIESYEAALSLHPRDVLSMEALEALYRETDRMEALRALLARRVELASEAERTQIQLRLAKLYELAFRDEGAAIAMLREVLAVDERQAEANDSLERMLELTEAWDELIALIGSRVDEADPDVRRQRLTRIAELYERKQNDVEAAVRTYERIGEEQGADESSLSALVGLYGKMENWPQEARTLEALAQMREGKVAIDLLHRAADIWEQRASDREQLSRLLQMAYERFPEDSRTVERLKKHLEAQGDYSGLASVLADELAGPVANGERLALLRTISDLYRDKLQDPGAAAHYLEQAISVNPEDRSVLVPLCDLYIAAGRQQDAVPMLRQIIESFGRQRGKELARHQHRLGNALEAAGDVVGALEAYDAAFKIDLTNIEILRDLGRLTHSQGDLDRAQKSFRALLLQKLEPNSGIEKADVYYYLGDIAAKQGDTRKAITMLERSLAEDRGHRDAGQLLSELKV